MRSHPLDFIFLNVIKKITLLKTELKFYKANILIFMFLTDNYVFLHKHSFICSFISIKTKLK